MLQWASACRLGAVVLLPPVLMLASACGGDDTVSKDNYDRVRTQLADTESQNQQLQVQLAAAQKPGGSQPAATAAAAASATPAAGSAAVAANAGVKPLIGARQLPKATPAPSPTPLPPGVTPPPRETPPASIYEAVGPFYVYTEVLATTSPSTFDVASTVSCTPSGVFIRGQRIVFRFEVVDFSTGKRVTDKEAKSMKILLPNGVESTGRWGQRGGGRVAGAPFMWSASWDIPLDYPLGGVDYSVKIETNDGKSFTWKPPVIIAPADGEDTRPKVMA